MARDRKRRQTGQIQKYKVVHPGKPKDEARKLVSAACCWELEELAQRLEFFANKEEIWDLEIEKVDGLIYRLTVCGGMFGNIVIDMYFAVLEDRSEIVILGVTEGTRWAPPPKFRLVKMRNRLSHYRRIVK